MAPVTSLDLALHRLTMGRSLLFNSSLFHGKGKSFSTVLRATWAASYLLSLLMTVLPIAWLIVSFFARVYPAPRPHGLLLS